MYKYRTTINLHVNYTYMSKLLTIVRYYLLVFPYEVWQHACPSSSCMVENVFRDVVRVAEQSVHIISMRQSGL